MLGTRVDRGGTGGEVEFYRLDTNARRVSAAKGERGRTCVMPGEGNGTEPRYTLPGVLNGVRGGMFGLPGVGFVPGLGPCISTVTPWGMLPIRTMVGAFPGGVVPGFAAAEARRDDSLA